MKIIIDVTKRKGHEPVLFLYTPKTEEATTTNISMKDYIKFQKGNHRKQMEIVMEACKDIFQLI